MRSISWSLAFFSVCGTCSLNAQSNVIVAPAPIESVPTQTLVAPESIPSANLESNPYAGDLFTRKTLTGDWRGVRTALADHGVTFDLFGTQFYQGVLQGGQSRRFEYGGKIDYLVNIDGQKLGLWQGLFVNLHAESRLGRDVNAIDNLLVPSNINMSFPVPDRNVTSITGLKVTQALSENFALFVGKVNTLEAFPLKFNSGYESNLPGLGGFQSTALVFNPIAARTVPYSAFGAGAAWIVDKVPVFSLTIMDPEERADRGFEDLYERGVVFVPDLILEGRPFGMPASLNLGGTYSTAKYRSVDPSSYLNLIRLGQLEAAIGADNLPLETGSWSVYANGYHALWVNPCDEKASWGVFGCAGLSDGDPNPIRYAMSVGVGGRSMMASRPLDTFGAGYYYLGLSSDFKNLTRPVLPQRDEYGVELFYNYAVTPWCRLTPNIQFARPSTVGRDTTILGGVRLQCIF